MPSRCQLCARGVMGSLRDDGSFILYSTSAGKIREVWFLFFEQAPLSWCLTEKGRLAEVVFANEQLFRRGEFPFCLLVIQASRC